MCSASICYAEEMLYEFTSLLQSFSHSPKSFKKLPITILIGPVNEAFRIFQGLHLSRTGCTSDCCKILLWQVFAISLSCSRSVELMLSMIKTLGNGVVFNTF